MEHVIVFKLSSVKYKKESGLNTALTAFLCSTYVYSLGFLKRI